MDRRQQKPRWAELSQFERIALIVWCVALAIATARLLLPTKHIHSVYPNYSGAATRWVEGRPVYTIARDYNYRYSPIVTVLFAAFLPLGDSVAGAIWCLANGIALVIATWIWMDRGAPRAIPPPARGLVLLLMLPLAIGNIASLQVNPLVIAMLLLAMVAFEHRGWTWAAALIAGAFFFKIYPLALGMLLILVRPREMSWRLIAAILIGLLLPYLFQHPHYVTDQYRGLLHYLIGEDRGSIDTIEAYRDVQFILRDLGLPIDLQAYRLIELAMAAVIALTCFWAARARWNPAVLGFLILSLSLGWMTALGPATEALTYVLLAPLVCWLMVARQTARGRVPWWIYLIVYVLLLYPVFSGLFPGHTPLRSPRLKFIEPTAALILMLAAWLDAFGLQRQEEARR